VGFFDGGNKSLSFGEVNTTDWFQVIQGGVITNIGNERQATDINTGALRTFPKSGDPIMQVPIDLDTRAGAHPAPPVDADDDGSRTLFISKGSGQLRAIQKALREAKVKDLEVGGTLYIMWQSGIGKIGDPRQFVAQYFAPASGGGMFADAAPAVQPPAAAAPGPRFDPTTGQPIAAAAAPVQAAPVITGYDQNTGQPIYGQPAPAPAAAAPTRVQTGFDPNTGQPVYAETATPPQQSFPGQVVPAAGQPMPGAAVTNPFLAR
jgi:hypothetical protein